MTSKKRETSAAALPGLYSELHTLGQAEEFEKTIKIANRSKSYCHGRSPDPLLSSNAQHLLCMLVKILSYTHLLNLYCNTNPYVYKR